MVRNTNGPPGGSGNRSVILGGGEGQLGHGVHAKGEKRPKLSGGAPGSGALGTGVHANGPTEESAGHVLPEQLPMFTGDSGVHRGADDGDLSQQLPKLQGCSSGCVPESSGTHVSDGNRPQLADTYARGRGVHNDNHLSEQRAALGDGNRGCLEAGATYRPDTCAQRRAWLLDWFGRLRDRLRTVRVCCGHWKRVCDSESVTTRLGVTGLFLDPPYRAKLADGSHNRHANIYGTDGKNTNDVVDEVIAYCLERGNDPMMRIAACCYEGEGYEVLLEKGWECFKWRTCGGYGNRSDVGKKNAGRERIFFSPNCEREPSLFNDLE